MTDSSQLYKADAGKLQTRLLFDGIPRTLLMLSAVLSYGAQKYEAHSWKNVDSERYKDAKFRHLLNEAAFSEKYDDESGLFHKAHEIVNSMFIFEQELDKIDAETFKELLKFNPPPQEHKEAKNG